MEKQYDYWLQSIPGIGGKTIRSLWQQGITSSELYQLPEKALKTLLSEKQVAALTQAKLRAVPEAKYERLRKDQINMVSLWEKAYPKKLADIIDPPTILFFRGVLPANTEKTIAIIGTRKASPYGEKMAALFGEAFASRGITVVSGMARGVDGISQSYALKAGGKSVAVLGCGVDKCYPPEHQLLYQELMKKGCIVSEYLPGTAARPELFPPRNRIISAMSDAVLVVEAREKSGTLITVEMALEQGKDVYAIPGRIGDPISEGCNRLLSEGAILARSPEQMLQELYGTSVQGADAIRAETTLGAKSISQKQPQNETQQKILAVMEQQPMPLDEIAALSGLSVTKVNAELFVMVLQKQVVQVSSGWFHLF